jgi:hypothetical protein
MKMLQQEHRPKCCRNSSGLPKGVAERTEARRNGKPTYPGRWPWPRPAPLACGAARPCPQHESNIQNFFQVAIVDYRLGSKS